MEEKNVKTRAGNFTVISNTFIRDNRLSFKAKGLLATMISLPDNWCYSVSGLETLSTDGKCSITSAIKELEEYGYLKRVKQVRDENNKFVGIIYDISEYPRNDYFS